MDLTPIKTPRLVKRVFPNYVWDVPADENAIYLTFDDGPTPEITNWTLNVLKQYQAKATFFCIGNNIEKHPDIFQNIIEAGHAVGNHTHNHLKGWKTTTDDYLENIERCEEALKLQMLNANPDACQSQNHQSEIGNHKSLITNLFRPPYGQITPKQGKKLKAKGYKIIMWDVLSFDWDKTISPETCLKNITNKAVPGSVIVFHDSVKAAPNMQYALPKVLDYFSRKGYCFKALS